MDGQQRYSVQKWVHPPGSLRSNSSMLCRHNTSRWFHSEIGCRFAKLADDPDMQTLIAAQHGETASSMFMTHEQTCLWAAGFSVLAAGSRSEASTHSTCPHAISTAQPDDELASPHHPSLWTACPLQDCLNIAAGTYMRHQGQWQTLGCRLC